MDTPDIVIYKVSDLLSGPVYPNPFQIFVAAGPFNCFQESGRDSGPGYKFSHADHTFPGCYRHDPGYDWNVDMCQFTAFAEIIKVPVIKKELGHNILCAGINFCLEVLDLLEAVWRFRMSFRESCHTDTHLRKMFLDVSNQFCSIGETVFRLLPMGLALGKISP